MQNAQANTKMSSNSAIVWLTQYSAGRSVFDADYGRGQTLLFSIVYDITERQQMEDALRQSEATTDAVG